MELEDIERRKSALGTILAQMDVPEMRRTLTIGNLRWLGRNLAVRNQDHPMFVTARTFLADILKFSTRK
jgi:chorismate-pyruvate lyase